MNRYYSLTVRSVAVGEILADYQTARQAGRLASERASQPVSEVEWLHPTDHLTRWRHAPSRFARPPW